MIVTVTWGRWISANGCLAASKLSPNLGRGTDGADSESESDHRLWALRVNQAARRAWPGHYTDKYKSLCLANRFSVHGSESPSPSGLLSQACIPPSRSSLA